MAEVAEKDVEQDRLIHENAARIAANAEAIRRQTEALERIRDHYYPPPAKLWRRAVGFAAKVLCVVLAYAGGVQAVDWYLNTRKASAMAADCAAVARRLFFAEGDAAGAARFYEKAAELNEGNVRYRIEGAFVKNMAVVAGLFDLGRPLTDAERQSVDEAQAEAAFLCATEPRDPMPHVLSAQTLVIRGEGAEARAAVDQAVALAPDSAQVHVSACAIHFMSGDVPGARRHLAEALRLDETLPLVVCWQGLLALAIDRDPKAARGFFAEAVRRTPRLAMAHAMLGRAMLASGSVAEARASFARALVLDARQKAAIRGTAETYAREGNLVVARLWLDRALAVDANDMAALLSRARIAEKDGDSAAAIADLSSALALAPLRADLYRARADVLARVGEAARAAADRRTAAALAGDR